MKERMRVKLPDKITNATRAMEAAALHKTAAFLAGMEAAGSGGMVLRDEEGGEQSERG